LKSKLWHIKFSVKWCKYSHTKNVWDTCVWYVYIPWTLYCHTLFFKTS
jgi:hypothetical protein